MLTKEDVALIDRLKESVFKIESDYNARLMTEAEYQEKCGLLEEVADKIEAISKREII